jgi:hypothetical protein
MTAMQMWSLLAALPAPPAASDAAAINSFYKAYGFVYIPSLLPPTEVQAIHTAIDDLIQNETAGPAYHPSTSERALLLTKFVTSEDYARVDRREDLAFHFDEAPCDSDPPVLRSINNLIFSAVGARLANDRRIIAVITAALGDDALSLRNPMPDHLVRFFNSRVFTKPAGGAGTAWHRDIRFFNMVDNGGESGQGVRTAINALLLLDEHTVENGALRVVPGSHTNTSRRGALDLVEEFGEAYREAQQNAEAGSADAPTLPGEFSLVGLPVGTLVLVDHYTLHGSGPNVAPSTDKASRRRMVSLGFAGPHIATLMPGDDAPQPARNIAVRGTREEGEVADYYTPPEWSLGPGHDEL